MTRDQGETPLAELTIALTSPPSDAPPEALARIELRFEDQVHSEDLLLDPVTPQEQQQLRWYLEEYWRWPYEQFAVRGQEAEKLLVTLGKRLYERAFGTAGEQMVIQPWNLEPDVDRQITIVSTLPSALSIPWELLHDDRGFLALRGRHPVSIIRRLPQRQRGSLAARFQPPLRILLVTARPDDAGFIDPRGISRELLDEVEQQVRAGAIALEFLRPPTMPALRQRLVDASRPPIHLLHFDGHGAFRQDAPEQDGRALAGILQGMLAFETEEGKLDLVSAEDLANVLQDSGVRLAILTACESALGAKDDIYSSVAARLIQGGVDAVVAMSASVLVASATRYVEAFYRALVQGASVPLAQERARQALHDDPRRHLSGRTLDEEPEPVRLRDWWLPHLYQQRPLLLRATAPTIGRTTPTEETARLSERMPEPPKYRFSGRARELLQIERWLLQRKLVVLQV